MNVHAQNSGAGKAGKKHALTLSTLALLGCLSFAPMAHAENITLNLKNAELSTLIATVADVTNKNFIIDPRVRAKVSVISKKPMDAKEVYQVFLSILQVYGFAAVDTGSVIKILPDVNAKQSGIPNASERSPGHLDELVTRVVAVQNVNAAQLVPILRPLIPQQGHLAAYTPTNVLIISDRAINIDRMMEIIVKMDQASNDDIEIIQLTHASAADTVRILQTLEQQASQSGQRSPGQEVKLISDDRTNSILLSGDKSSRLRIRAVVAHLDTPVQSGGNTQVVYLHYANAKDMVSVLTGVTKSSSSTSSGSSNQNNNSGGQMGGAPGGGIVGGSSEDGKVDILADETTNALVITAPPDAMRRLRAIISELDVRRAQVLVEAVIAEVGVNKSSKLGVEWLAGSRDPGAVGIVNLGSLTGVLEGAATGITGGSDTAAVLGAVQKMPTGGSIAAVGGSNDVAVGALISALASDGSNNILSTPSIVTLDNEEAEIRVATTVPFVTGSYTSTSGEGSANPTNPFQTIERQDVGIILKIKPQINEGSAVKLNLEQEVSNLGAGSGQDQQTQKRSIKTTVIVEDGQLLVLGGLVDQQVRAGRTKVPLLGDIPVLGALFRSKNSQNNKSNLMVFLHPRILRDAATNMASTTAKYDYIRAEQLARRREGIDLMPGESQPTLPTMDKMLKLPEPFDTDTKSTK